jgi:hypothetical protein
MAGQLHYKYDAAALPCAPEELKLKANRQMKALKYSTQMSHETREC